MITEFWYVNMGNPDYTTSPPTPQRGGPGWHCVVVDRSVAEKYLCTGIFGLIMKTPFTGLTIEVGGGENS
jgi:hypothetical protein